MEQRHREPAPERLRALPRPRARPRGPADARGDDRAAARAARPRDAAARDRRALAEPSCPTARSTCRPTHLVDPSEEGAAERQGQARAAGERVPHARLRAGGGSTARSTTPTAGSASTACCASTPSWSCCWRARSAAAGRGATGTASASSTSAARASPSGAPACCAGTTCSSRGGGWSRSAVLSPAEQALVQDLLGYAHQDFGHLLPFGSAAPRRRRPHAAQVAAALAAARSDRASSPSASASCTCAWTPRSGVISLQRAALDIDDARADAAPLAGRAQAPGRAPLRRRPRRAPGRARAQATASGGWRVEPQPLLGFRNAPARTRVYLTCTLDAATYSRRWQGEDWAQVGAHHRDTILPELWPWLLARGYASRADEARLEPFMHTLGRRAAHLRPSHPRLAHVVVRAEAETLDDAGLLAGEIHDGDQPRARRCSKSRSCRSPPRGRDEPMPPAVPTPAKRSGAVAETASAPCQTAEAARRAGVAPLSRNSRCTRSSSVSSAWKATASRFAFARRHGWPSTSARISTPGPCSAIQGARMNTRAQRRRRRCPRIDSPPRSSELAPERVALGAHVHQAEMVAVEHDQPRARAEHRNPPRRPAAPAQLAQRLASPSRSIPSVIVVDSPPGITSPSRPSRSAGMRTSRTSAPTPAASARAPRTRPAARATADAAASIGRSARRHSDADATSRAGPAAARRPSFELSRLTIAGPSPREAAATRSGSCQCVVASTIARARAGGSSDLKMPEPTNTPSAPSAIISAASAGVAIPPAQNSTTGRRPSRGDLAARDRAARPAPWRRSPARRSSSVRQAADLAVDLAHVADRLDDVARAGLALRADHRRALADPPQRLAEVRRAAHERHLERPLVDVVGLVRGRQHLRLVDVVDLQRLQHLRLDEVPDPRLRHHRDRSPPPGCPRSSPGRTSAPRRRRGGCRRARAPAPSPRRRPRPRRPSPARA